MRIVPRLYVLGLMLCLWPSLSQADQVTNLNVNHHDGQSFLTWTVPNPNTTGWTYRLYVSTSQISDLNTATLVGSVGDSTWCDRRLTRIKGTVYPYLIDSLGTPLDPSQGLIVVTPATDGNRFYAVTAQSALQAEDRSITSGQNSLTSSVTEVPGLPRPVYQRTLMTGNVGQEVYTLWTSPVATPLFPAMANRYGQAYDCGIVRGGILSNLWHALAVLFHVRGGNFTTGISAGMVGEWILALDNFTRNQDGNTWWFGYHQDYDPEVNSSPPTSGQVIDYDRRRNRFLIEWALRNFPVDQSRTYAAGSSMGGSGALMAGLWWPDLIAASFAVVPHINFQEVDDPNLYNDAPGICEFNSGMGQRTTCDNLWGLVGTNLLGPDGQPVYDQLNDSTLAVQQAVPGVTPILMFSGRQDRLIGWHEKPGFYQVMRENHLGGTFLWDNGGHSMGPTSEWYPQVNAQNWLYRFRLDRSYPALSNCSGDNDPGDGTLTTGDPLGQINAYVDWDSLLLDIPNQWQIRFTLQDLHTNSGLWPAPESLTADVTPRRLQQFMALPNTEYNYQVIRYDGVFVQTGTVMSDGQGVITVPGVKLYRRGGWLRITLGPVGVGEEAMSTPGLRLTAVRNPVRSKLELDVRWPTAGPADIRVFDLNGRQQEVLLDQSISPTRMHLQAQVDDLSPGVYFVRARQAGREATIRIAVIR